MKNRYIPAIIMLLAGGTVSILNLVQKIDVIAGLKRLLIVLLLFYIIGLIAKSIIVKAINHMPEEPLEETEEEEISEEIEEQEE